ncbi:MAG: DegT/DnrJ/EryC1/StrS family aminotransferase [Candidatus Omnitrophica bacterium]|nr:DegT/DnrJ/EryC1/StrS family aminotransferase [Candidatus Omnitrophota bacterium]MDD5238155.1 DegT/DnrJ/EryC1/StrS family aminotransferase [Candidatus Omnitrophota bacterium]
MIKIPIIDLKKQIGPIRGELDAAIKKVIDNTNFILGEEVRNFEESVKKYCRVKYALGVSNGTDAIKLALVALGIKPGEGVLCPNFTYYATASSIATMGAVPVFVDIEPDTYNISAPKIEEAVKRSKNINLKAVVPVHLYGQCADIDNIVKLAQNYGLKVIEDTAQAFGAEYKGEKAGTIAECGAVSFYPGKNLGAFGDAGMVLTNSQSLAERLDILRNQGNKEKYQHVLLGYNHRMDTIQAAILQVKLKYLDAWNKKRQENAGYFDRNLEGLGIKTPLVAKYSTHIYHQYVLRLNNPSSGLIEHLRKKGIDTRVYYPVPLHLQECFTYLGYKKGDFPESEKASIETLAIPVYPDLTKEEMDYIISSIEEFLR